MAQWQTTNMYGFAPGEQVTCSSDTNSESFLSSDDKFIFASNTDSNMDINLGLHLEIAVDPNENENVGITEA